MKYTTYVCNTCGVECDASETEDWIMVTFEFSSRSYGCELEFCSFECLRSYFCEYIEEVEIEDDGGI